MVGYRDYGDVDRLVTLDFTPYVEDFVAFLDGQMAMGGADEAEDVLGGMNVVAFKENWWQSEVRVLYHIGDAPCHGIKFHSRLVKDFYPKGHHNDPKPLTILQKLKENRVKYMFMRINSSTDIMIAKFNAMLAAGVDEDIVIPVDAEASKPYIETICVNADVLRVMQVITASLSVYLSNSFSQGTSLDSSAFSEEAADSFGPAAVGTLVEEFVMQYPIFVPTDLKSFLLESTDKCVADIPSPMTPIRVKIAGAPFAAGIHRQASWGERMLSSGDWESVVFKNLKPQRNKSQITKGKHECFLSCHRAASFCAVQFNACRPKDCPTIIFVESCLAQFNARLDQPFMICEQRVCSDASKFEKYNNNTGFVEMNPTPVHDTIHDAVQAFSHWTYCYTKQEMLIVECQGVYNRDDNEFLLTDPAVHSIQMQKFGSTNMAVEGYIKFFRTHKCNSYCKALKLKPPSKDELLILKRDKERMFSDPSAG
ncbi:hypothetical protein EON65_50520 [archaeon]|nr:MAG: hypothetical protein EON65_50520 [archaeon]